MDHQFSQLRHEIGVAIDIVSPIEQTTISQYFNCYRSFISVLITIVSSCTYFICALVGCSSSREEECVFSSSEVCPRSRAGEWVFPASEVKFIHVKGNGSSLQMNLGKGAQATSRAAPSAGAHCHWCGCSLAEARSLVTICGGGCVLRVSLPGVTPCTTPSHGSAVPRGQDFESRWSQLCNQQVNRQLVCVKSNQPTTPRTAAVPL